MNSWLPSTGEFILQKADIDPWQGDRNEKLPQSSHVAKPESRSQDQDRTQTRA